ncbi:MAG: aminotransferase class I/II-fold pyridoxal phosphate-dependent enzyme [Lachnospiraceae bacterium]|nr:aminotransferase class I/II-fold pyridoxal phosphate-dependent enzyme [Lachnospiraceae bacterium]
MIIHSSYAHGGDIYSNHVTLDFSVNVNPLGTPEPVKEAVRQAAEALEAYPDPYCRALREKLAKHLKTDPDRILCGNGAAELIYQMIAALKPKRTLLPVPSFSDYESALAAAGCTAVYYPLLREEGFLPNERILSTITEDVDLLMLCSPNNPTGRLIDRELLLTILERCRRTGTWLFLDECFGELTEEETPSLAAELLPGDKVFLLRAFTKTYAMAGLRLGYAVCPDRELSEQICGSSQPWNVSSIAQAAGLAALDCTDWAQKARILIREEKRYLTEELSLLGICVLPGDANYLLLQGVPGLYEKLKQRGILIRNCENYRGLDAGDCRIAIRKHEDNETLIAAVKEIIHA